jgi:hypothetical protein
MSTSKQSYKSGDIFNFEIADNEYGFGRVILDIYPQCLKPGLIDQQSLLLNGNEESIFIELFEKTSTNPELEIDTKKVLVPGLFTSNFEIEDNYWKVIGNEPIDPTKIDFPEFLTHEGASQGKFIKGELSTIIDISYEDVEAIKIYANEFAVFSIPDIVLFALGRKDEMETNSDAHHMVDMSKNDLRFSKHKAKVYDKLPADFKGKYYDVSKALGYDLKRFFQK